MNPGDFCRDVEAHLCRRNGGHLIRIVGPAFDLVCGWQAQQIPVAVVRRAIDRVAERRAASPASRRPLRIDFCEADVLELFDEWRRAVGVPREAPAEGTGRTRQGPSLPAYLERVILELTAVRGAAGRPAALRDCAGRLAQRIDAEQAAARTARGDRRVQLLARLRAADDALLAAARDAADAPLLERLRGEAETELADYRARLPPAEYDKALRAAADRLLREHLDLPRIAFD